MGYRTATDSGVKDLFKTVAEEEFNHCVHSWKLAAWAISASGKDMAHHFAKTIGKVSRATDAKPLLGASAERKDIPILPNFERFGILSWPVMNDIDRKHGPALVRELLVALQSAIKGDRAMR